MYKTYKDIYQKALDYNSKIKSTDGRFTHYVYIGHIDGTTLMFDSAFLMSLLDNNEMKWIICFTEHHGFHVYPDEDLTFCVELKPIKEIERLK